MKTQQLLITLATGVSLHGLAFAQQVPAIEAASIQSTYMPAGISSRVYPTLPVLSDDKIQLSSQRAKGSEFGQSMEE